MDVPAHMASGALLWSANVLLAGVLLFALRYLTLSRLRNNEFSHVFFAACVVLLLLWNTRVGVLPALNFHLLGVTAATLMFGWAYAVFAVLLATIGSFINQGAEWAALGLNVLVTGCIPILVTQFMLFYVQQRLPHNFFIYIYLNGFLTAGLSILASGLVGAWLVLLADSGNASWLSYQFYPYLPLVFFSEALVNGIVMTALVAMRPGWVCSFDDALYINNK